MFRKLLVSAALLIISLAAFAQNGSIGGSVTDAATKEPVIGASVLIQGTQVGAMTDFEGKFSIPNVKPGTYSIIVSFITYATDTISDVTVEEGKRFEVTVALHEEAKTLSEVVVSGQADKTSESVLAMTRKNSVEFVQNIGAQELSRKGVSNAESAVTQVTGVSKQQGVKNVFVRGLGDRYNSTSLNGLPLPSEDPEYKNITLDFFSTDVIKSIDVNKTFGSQTYGDVGGANINIVSQELFEDREFTVSGSVGANSLAMGNTFYRADGTNFLGTGDKNIPITSLKQYNFKNSFQPVQTSGPILNSGLTISGGKKFYIGNNALKAFVVGGMSSDFAYRKGVARQVNPEGGIRQDLSYEKYLYSASQLVLGNLSYEFGKNTIAYNGMFIHDNKQSVANYTGFSPNALDDINDPNGYKSFIRRQQVNDNSLLVNQLSSVIAVSDKLSLDVRGSFNSIRGNEPDRRTNSYKSDGESYSANSGSAASNHRFFSYLKENDIAGNATASYSFGSGANNKLVVGYNFRNTDRDFEAVQFNFDWNSLPNIPKDDPDAIFNQGSIDNNTFELETQRGTNGQALKPFTYEGGRTIHAGLISLTYDITKSFTAIVGGRFEKINQSVHWDVNIDPVNPNIPNDNTVVRDLTYFLPNLNLKYTISENDMIRFAASKTYTMPQFKEVAPFLYEDVNVNSFGNPKLLPAENYNVDLRYEHYFFNDEMIAFTGFYKRIDNAINRVLVASAALEMSYVNTGTTNVAGGEIEFRKDLFRIVRGESTSSFRLGSNVSYLYSNQQLIDVATDDLAFDPNDKESTLEGASTWLVNSDLTFLREGSRGRTFMTSLVLNYFSDRIFSIGAPKGNQHIYERGVPTLDLISKFGLTQRLSLSLNVKNLLNPEYRLTKKIDSGEKELISSYERGTTTSIGFTYKF